MNGFNFASNDSGYEQPYNCLLTNACCKVRLSHSVLK